MIKSNQSSITMRFTLSVAFSVVLLSGAAQAGTRVLEPNDVFRLQWASDPQIRRDGSQIAYVRIRNDIMTDRLFPTVWLIDTASGAQTPLSGLSGQQFSPRFSPDGSRVAFISTGSDGHPQIAVRYAHGESAVLTHLQEAPSDITWSPDGKQIAFIMLEPVAPSGIGKPLAKPPGADWGGDARVIETMNFRADGQGMDKPGFRHIYLLSADGGGAPRPLTSGSFSDAGPIAFSPDGKSLYFASNHSDEWQREPEDWARHTAMTLSIFRASVADGVLTQLSHEIGPYDSPVVSPDGKSVAYLGYQDKHVGNQDVRLHLMDADGKNPRVVSESLDRSIMEAQWAADGRSLLVSYVDHGITKVGRMSLNGKLEPVASDLAQLDEATHLPYSSGQFSVSAKGVVAFSGGAAEHLPEVFVAHDGKAQRLTYLNAQLLQEVTIGKLSALPVKSSADRRDIDAWELLPPNYDPSKKYPLILEIHGGPYASYGPTFSIDYQLYAAAGYVVVYGNPRGSTSYGEEFANTIYNNYPSQDYDDLMSSVDEAVKKGGVDPDNLFITGSSGGGVLSSWSIGKTHRFRAAVVQRPVINWTSWLLTTDMMAFGRRYWFKQMPWDDQETYWKHSPLSLVGNVTTPTMVVVGLSDLRTTVGEAEQYYQALQLRHVPTAMYEIPDAPHGLQRPSQLAEQSTAIIEWFERYRKH